MLGSVAYITQIFIPIHNYSNLGAADLSFPIVCFQNFISKHRTLASKKPKTKQQPLVTIPGRQQYSSLAPLDMANDNHNRATTFAIYGILPALGPCSALCGRCTLA